MSRVNTVVFDAADAGRLYLGGDSAYSQPLLKVSTDGGASWTRTGAGLAGVVYAVATVPRSPDLLICGTAQGTYVSTDRGANFTRKGTMTTVRAIAVDTVNPQVMYVGTAAGAWSSTDGGENWSAFNDGLGNTDILSLALRSGEGGILFAGTAGGSVYCTDPLVAVAEPGRAPAGRGGFTLTPNPCRAAAVLHRRSAGTARLTLSDVAGRQVWRADVAPGRAAVELPALAPGVYLVRLDDGTGAATRKLVVQ